MQQKGFVSDQINRKDVGIGSFKKDRDSANLDNVMGAMNIAGGVFEEDDSGSESDWTKPLYYSTNYFELRNNNFWY